MRNQQATRHSSAPIPGHPWRPRRPRRDRHAQRGQPPHDAGLPVARQQTSSRTGQPPRRGSRNCRGRLLAAWHSAQVRVRQTKGLMHDDCASNSGSVGAHRRLGVRRCRTRLAGAPSPSLVADAACAWQLARLLRSCGGRVPRLRARGPVPARDARRSHLPLSVQYGALLSSPVTDVTARVSAAVRRSAMSAQ